MLKQSPATTCPFPCRLVCGSSLAITLALMAAGCSTAWDTDDRGARTTIEAAMARQPLPAFEPGTRVDDVHTRLADWPPGHRFTTDGDPMQGWEWNGPDGMRVEAWLSGGVAMSMHVSRTWGTGAPPVDGRKLPDGFAGRSLEALEAVSGPGMLVDRTWALDALGNRPVATETYKWAIHDRGLDTGLFMTVTTRGGTVVAVRHRWSDE